METEDERSVRYKKLRDSHFVEYLPENIGGLDTEQFGFAASHIKGTSFIGDLAPYAIAAAAFKMGVDIQEFGNTVNYIERAIHWQMLTLERNGATLSHKIVELGKDALVILIRVYAEMYKDIPDREDYHYCEGGVRLICDLCGLQYNEERYTNNSYQLSIDTGCKSYECAAIDMSVHEAASHGYELPDSDIEIAIEDFFNIDHSWYPKSQFSNP